MKEENNGKSGGWRCLCGDVESKPEVSGGINREVRGNDSLYRGGRRSWRFELEEIEQPAVNGPVSSATSVGDS